MCTRLHEIVLASLGRHRNRASGRCHKRLMSDIFRRCRVDGIFGNVGGVNADALETTIVFSMTVAWSLNDFLGRAGARAALFRRGGRFLFRGGAREIQGEKFFQDLFVAKIDIEPVSGGDGGVEFGVGVG